MKYTHEILQHDLLAYIYIYTCSGARSYYKVSGGPITVTAHSKIFVSSTRPALNPSTGLRVSSDAFIPDER